MTSFTRVDKERNKEGRERREREKEKIETCEGAREKERAKYRRWLASHRHAHTFTARVIHARIPRVQILRQLLYEEREGRAAADQLLAAHAYTRERRRKDEGEPGLERNSSSRAVDTVLNLDLGHASPTTSQFDVLRKAERTRYFPLPRTLVSLGVRRVRVFVRSACRRHHHTLDIHTVRPGWKGRARSEVEVFP